MQYIFVAIETNRDIHLIAPGAAVGVSEAMVRTLARSACALLLPKTTVCAGLRAKSAFWRDAWVVLR